MVPLVLSPTFSGSVPLCHAGIKAPQCDMCGGIRGIVVPPIPINRIQEPSLVALKIGNRSQVDSAV